MASYPVLFFGHGSPMNAIENNEFTREWEKIGTQLPRPKNIVCISAHWTTIGTMVTAMDEPRTIHDFYGFPDELTQVQYPAPGNPVLAEEICKHSQNKIKPDFKWGYDHGCWSVLKRLFPDADVPVIQLSLDTKLSPKQHYELAQHIKYLRDKDVLVIGTGNIVHNLGQITWTDNAHPWAIEFDEYIKEKIKARDYRALFNYEDMGEPAILSVPSLEHYLPLLYILGMATPFSDIKFFCEKVTMGAISMTSLIVEN